MKFFLLTLVILFSSCSKLDLAYDFAPKFVTDSLEENFNFSSERYNQVKDVLAVDFKINKQIIKTEVLLQIEKLLVLAEAPELSEKQLKDFIIEAKTAQKKLAELFRPTFEVVINDLNVKEFSNMKEKSNERFIKIEERLADQKKYKEKALESFEDNMENFFDSVSDEQKKIYEDFIDVNFDYYRDQLEFRKSTLLKFESLLEKKTDFLNYAYKFYTADDSIKTPQFLKKQEAYLNNTYVVVGKLWKSLSAEQRKEFKTMLSDLKNDISSLK